MEERYDDKVERNKKGISGYGLKLLAAGTMLCSHIYKCLLIQYPCAVVLDMIGRIAFPVFCFLLVEGFCYTHNRKRYLLRLWISAVFSEIPFDMAFLGRLTDNRCQNVLFTMVIGFLVMWGMDKVSGAFRYMIIAAGMVLAWLLRVDYGFYGIWIISIFYLFRGMKKECTMIQCVSQAVSICLYGEIQIFSLLSLLFIRLYNHEQGRKRKYVFYLFYPLHLIILAMI